MHRHRFIVQSLAVGLKLAHEGDEETPVQLLGVPAPTGFAAACIGVNLLQLGQTRRQLSSPHSLGGGCHFPSCDAEQLLHAGLRLRNRRPDCARGESACLTRWAGWLPTLRVGPHHRRSSRGRQVTDRGRQVTLREGERPVSDHLEAPYAPAAMSTCTAVPGEGLPLRAEKALPEGVQRPRSKRAAPPPTTTNSRRSTLPPPSSKAPRRRRLSASRPDGRGVS